MIIAQIQRFWKISCMRTKIALCLVSFEKMAWQLPGGWSSLLFAEKICCAYEALTVILFLAIDVISTISFACSCRFPGLLSL